MHKAAALWHTSAETSRIQAADITPTGKHDCLIRALYSLISTGTERLVASGQVPGSLYQTMQVPFMEGSFGFPVKYGYSLVGQVEEGPASLKNKQVHLLHPHQDFCYVPADSLFVLPAQVPAERAILASNLETALNAVWDSQVSIGDRVLLAGFGIIGSLTARLLQKIPAVDLKILEPDANRQQMALQMGFRLADPDEQDFDLAFHCSGTQAGLQYCIDKAGFEGKIIELSWYGQQKVTLSLGGSFHSQRKQIISSQVSHLPAGRRSRWDYGRRKKAVFDLLQDADFDAHITQTVSFARLPELFRQIRQHDRSALCWRVAY